MADQCSRIDAGDHRDAVTGQKFLGGLVGAPVARKRREFADDQSFDERLHRFVIEIVGAIVANLGIGEDDNLAGIRRIGENLLVAGEAGVENNFPRVFDGRTKTTALEDRAVFQGEDCCAQVC